MTDSYSYSDTDECRTAPFLCRNGRCRNSLGSFHCECADGYTLSVDGQHCRDLDECKEVKSSPLTGSNDDRYPVQLGSLVSPL